MCDHSASLLWAIVALVALAPVSAGAQEGPVSLHGRHALSLSVGPVDVTAGVSASATQGTDVSTDLALSAYLGYRYWYAADWAFQVDAGALEVESDISTSGGGARITSSTVTAVLAGVRFQPRELALGRSGRPFLELTPGFVTGTTSEILASPATVSSETQSVPALRPGLGVDWILHRRFAVGLTAHYLWTGDFDRPVSGYDNMSSFDLVFTLALLLGRAR